AEGSTLRPFFARLDVGVRIFFLISAFLLYRPFVAARLGSEQPRLARAYAWRRFLRVAPPYWLALCVIGLWLGEPGVFTVEHAPLYFGFAHVYTNATLTVSAMPQAWSLSWHVALPEYLDYFAIGMALAAVSVAGRPGRLIDLVARRPWVGWLGAVVLFVVVSKGIGLTGGVHDAETEAPYLARHYLYGAIALGLFLPAVFGDPDEGLIRRVLAWRPILWIGLVSYGAYLYHFPV